MTPEERLKIARKSFREIQKVFNKWQNKRHPVYSCWDRFVIVDGEIFHADDLFSEDGASS